METLTTDTNVTVASNKPYEQVIRTLEFVRETEHNISMSGFVVFAKIDHGA